eukprot:9346129-Heterocapsa_arctica.AAC.1
MTCIRFSITLGVNNTHSVCAFFVIRFVIFLICSCFEVSLRRVSTAKRPESDSGGESPCGRPPEAETR